MGICAVVFALVPERIVIAPNDDQVREPALHYKAGAGLIVRLGSGAAVPMVGRPDPPLREKQI
jgi:hypothetical protein